ncbi:MAG: hypothetical protein EOO43_16015 [Flavobacterium sp.]|nr:MAG: hypothetical protein EOO43_16015 [Flavobacterium sp.]
MNIGARNYFRIAQSLIRDADPHYYQHSFLGNRIQIAKDEFIERKVLSLFQKMLPKVSFSKSVTYTYLDSKLAVKCAKAKDGKYELDILGNSALATYLIEVKAGLVSDEAKRGAISSIKTDLSGIVGDAICQSYRAQRFIETSENPTFFTAEGDPVMIDSSKPIYRISVSFSYVGGIIAALSKLQEFGVIEENAGYAWTINIFDLIPFTDLMESELMLLDYLNRRLALYADSRLTTVDEMQLLGLYFDNNLKIRHQFKDATHVQLTGYSADIDNFYDKGGPKPRKQGPLNFQKEAFQPKKQIVKGKT